MKMKHLISLLPLVLFCSGASAAIYKWVDENNQIHYSTQPPKQGDVTRVKVKQSQPAVQEQEAVETKTEAVKDAKDAKDATVTPAATDEAQKAQAAEDAKIAAEEAQLKAINCEKAKAHLTAIKEKPRMRIKAVNGQETALPQEQLDAEIKLTEGAVKRFCGEI